MTLTSVMFPLALSALSIAFNNPLSKNPSLPFAAPGASSPWMPWLMLQVCCGLVGGSKPPRPLCRTVQALSPGHIQYQSSLGSHPSSSPTNAPSAYFGDRGYQTFVGTHGPNQAALLWICLWQLRTQPSSSLGVDASLSLPLD